MNVPWTGEQFGIEKPDEEVELDGAKAEPTQEMRDGQDGEVDKGDFEKKVGPDGKVYFEGEVKGLGRVTLDQDPAGDRIYYTVDIYSIADLNRDHKVDSLDLAIMSQHWGAGWAWDPYFRDNWDIGTTGGSYSYASGVYSVLADGSDIWGNTDQFHYVSTLATGDFELSARVVSLDNIHSWSKAGVMVRETLDPGAQHVFMCVTPEAGEGRFAFQNRSVGTNGDSSSLHTAQGQVLFPDNTWVKIKRVGNTFTALVSQDGVSWEAFPGAFAAETDGPNPLNPLQVSMPDVVHVGLAVTSHAPGTLCIAQFDNVVLLEKGSNPTHGLVAHWTFDQNMGSIALDGSGGGHDGTLIGNVQWKDDQAVGSSSMQFNGNGHVRVPHDPDFDIITQITCAAWVRVDSFDQSWQAIVTKGDTAWRLQRSGATDSLEFACTGINVSGTAHSSILGSVNVNDGQWHHVAGVYDGTTIYLYIDAALDTSASALGTIFANRWPVMIGDNAEATGRYWNGRIDEVQIYARALSHTEIQILAAQSP
ncbi:MAG: hypothetical protein JSW27_01095 [Phycisphaerales bacterium]|nr:MAG: hypothetical protein JSW27_01095 [Phycisphaerales bacterium]